MNRIEQLKAECDRLEYWASQSATKKEKIEWLARLNANSQERKRLAMLLEGDRV